MRFLFDTNVCISLLRTPVNGVLRDRVAQADPADIALCSIVWQELLFGAHRSRDAAKSLPAVEVLLSQYVCLDFDGRAARESSLIRADLAARGLPIGPYDLQIAGIVKANGLTLITHNTAEFQRVSGLAIEDWQI